MPKKKAATAMEYAVSQLSRMPLGKKELLKKLHGKEYPLKEILNAVAECERYGYINDELVSETKVTCMRDRGDGERKIRFTLRKKGFSRDVIDSAIRKDSAANERDESAVALALLEKKRMTLMHEKDPLKRRMKTIRALAAKGFAPGTAYAAAAKFLNEKNAYEFPEFPEES